MDQGQMEKMVARVNSLMSNPRCHPETRMVKIVEKIEAMQRDLDRINGEWSDINCQILLLNLELFTDPEEIDDSATSDSEPATP